MRTDFDYSHYYYKKSKKTVGADVSSARKRQRRAAREKKRAGVSPVPTARPHKLPRYTSGRKIAMAVCAVIIIVSIIGFFVFSPAKAPPAAISLASYDYFAVNMGTYADEASARIQAERVRARGAAGYVAADNNYKVLASCYTTKKDAESVIANLKKQNTSASLFTISMPAVKLGGVSGNLKNAIEEALLLHKEIYGSLYALTVDIDTGKSSAAGIFDALGALSLNVDGVVRKLSQQAESESSAVQTHIKALCISVKNLLETINTAENYFEISINLRYNYLKILFMYIELFKEITN